MGRDLKMKNNQNILGDSVDCIRANDEVLEYWQSQIKLSKLVKMVNERKNEFYENELAKAITKC
jgi:hypothetical protein